MRERIRRLTKGSLHVMLGGMFAAAFGLLVFAFATSLENAHAEDSGSVWALVFLAAVVALAVSAAATVPAVRPLEITAARYLLDLNLPDAVRPAAWDSRRRGAAWLTLNVLVGGVAVFALLFLVPIGFGMALYPFGSAEALRIPGLPTLNSASGLGTWWVSALSPIPVVASVASFAAATAILRRAGIVVLGPTDADQLELSRRREVALARSNRIAREIHDSLGHALTAIGIQSEAGARVLDHDPEFARSALSAIHTTSTDALTELDRVLGVLRGEESDRGGGEHAAESPVDRIRVMLERAAPAASFSWDGDSQSMSAAAADDLYRVAQESITNAVRHGTGPIAVHVSLGDTIELTCRNAIGAQTSATESRRRGLGGLRERVLLAGGTVEFDDAGGVWTVRVSLPGGMRP